MIKYITGKKYVRFQDKKKVSFMLLDTYILYFLIFLNYIFIHLYIIYFHQLHFIICVCIFITQKYNLVYLLIYYFCDSLEILQKGGLMCSFIYVECLRQHDIILHLYVYFVPETHVWLLDQLDMCWWQWQPRIFVW